MKSVMPCLAIKNQIDDSPSKDPEYLKTIPIFITLLLVFTGICSVMFTSICDIMNICMIAMVIKLSTSSNMVSLMNIKVD